MSGKGGKAGGAARRTKAGVANATTTAVRPVRVVIDLRCFQDPEYAARGIGQHGRSLIDAIRRTAGVELAGIADPLLSAPPDDVVAQFGEIGRDPADFSGDVFINPSPMTHDTSTLVTALRKGMRRLAVVHDFIPLRATQPAADAGGAAGEEALIYRYRLRSLVRYDILLPNSEATRAEIGEAVPDFAGAVVMFGGRSRFGAGSPGDRPLPGEIVRLLAHAPRFAFVAAADDPRKNVAVALQAAAGLRSMGLATVIGGGFAEVTQNRLNREFRAAFLAANPEFLPRLSDEELRACYREAVLVIVPSRDEGFSLPVAEAIGLGARVIASDIPAHREQIADRALLFDPGSAGELLDAARHALALDPEALGTAYRDRSDASEALRLRELIAAAPIATPPLRSDHSVTVVGPVFEKPSGIAVYNRLMVAAFAELGIAHDYVDVDAMSGPEFYAWLFNHQQSRLLIVLGNNDLMHARAFDTLQNIPAPVVMHDSRLFEFLLNRYGADYIARLWERRRGTPLPIGRIFHWQSERKQLGDSFLDPLVARARRIVVHSRLQADHLRDAYGTDKARLLPFAMQLSVAERASVLSRRAKRVGYPDAPPAIAAFGETEPIKGSVEMIFAIALLRAAGYDARLHVVGRSEGDYHQELLRAAAAARVAHWVSFHQHVNRATYLTWLAVADVAVQLRYPLFGQASGPVSDVLNADLPLVTTVSLAASMNANSDPSVETVPDVFSPLHVSEAIRTLLDQPKRRRASQAKATHTFNNYVPALIDLLE